VAPHQLESSLRAAACTTNGCCAASAEGSIRNTRGTHLHSHFLAPSRRLRSACLSRVIADHRRAHEFPVDAEVPTGADFNGIAAARSTSAPSLAHMCTGVNCTLTAYAATAGSGCRSPNSRRRGAVGRTCMTSPFVLPPSRFQEPERRIAERSPRSGAFHLQDQLRDVVVRHEAARLPAVCLPGPARRTTRLAGSTRGPASCPESGCAT